MPQLREDTQTIIELLEDIRNDVSNKETIDNLLTTLNSPFFKSLMLIQDKYASDVIVTKPAIPTVAALKFQATASPTLGRRGSQKIPITKEGNLKRASRISSSAATAAAESAENVRRISLRKGSTGGLGFNIVGGTDHQSDIFVSRVIEGGVADKAGSLQRGDQIIEVNGVPLVDMTHAVATDTLKNCNIGDIHLVVCYDPRSSFNIASA